MPADDSIFEKALERQMRKRPVDGIDGAAQSEVCPDAELLAAYHERSLGDEEMVLWKEHIANCGRCQDVLAALETTEEISLGEREGEFAEVVLQGTQTIRTALSVGVVPDAKLVSVSQYRLPAYAARFVAPFCPLASVVCAVVVRSTATTFDPSE